MASLTWITLLFATLPSILCTETCDNKFEYEFGVLQKLEMLEKEKTHLATELNVQAYTNRALADQVSALTRQVTASYM
ncbi:hypothetical protein MAR_020450 [Mya arenaria]|uniref:Uncharacterized protein n=1 Tax=Mya arenaria TaxID=6604 RepID=A0ABY7ED63_MYAAR|nr:hypothetical protein MAR_020449 [Mya arenaria]WAR05081.1 hypothetical protein MAR_020450 [Mya arenaria]